MRVARCVSLERVAALLLGVCAMLPVRAQTLAEALEQAWSIDPLAATLEAHEEEAAAQAEIASGLLPAPASVSMSALSDRVHRDDGSRKWEIELGAPLWLPGQQAARQDEAQARIEAAARRRAALRLVVAGEVRDLWWSLAAARNARELAARRLATASTLQADVRRRFEAGDVARLDLNLAYDEQLTAQAALAETRVAEQRAEHAYRVTIGAPAPAALAPETAVPTASVDAHPALAAAMSQARHAHAALASAVQSARDAPTLALRMERERGDFGERFSNAIGVKLTIPFASGARLRQQRATARVDTSRADAELARMRLQLDVHAQRARLELETSERRLALAETRRELTAENLRLAGKSFALGESGLVALLRVRAAALDAEALHARERVAYAASLSRLNEALGVLP